MGSMTSQDSYTKFETDNLLTNKVSNIGNVSLPGRLGIGTTYTHSRIICNAGFVVLLVMPNQMLPVVTACLQSYQQQGSMVAGCTSKLIMTTVCDYQVEMTK